MCALFASVALFTACGSDDDDKDEKKVYLVKSISRTNKDGEIDKVVYTYEDGKFKKITDTNDRGKAFWEELSYVSTTSINVIDSDGDEAVYTMDATNNVVKNYESNYGTETYIYVNGYLSSVKWENKDTEDPYVDYENLEWTDGNLTTYRYGDGEAFSTAVDITYSDIDNKTNFDIFLLLNDGDCLYSTQFIKNVSKKIPSSLKGGDQIAIITTTLDEKGRPATVSCEGDTYTFEYFE